MIVQSTKQGFYQIYISNIDESNVIFNKNDNIRRSKVKSIGNFNNTVQSSGNYYDLKNINYIGYNLISMTSTNKICGILDIGYVSTNSFISVNGRDFTTIGTDEYPLELNGVDLNLIPKDIQLQMKPKFAIQNIQSKEIIPLIGDIPNFQTNTLVEISLEIEIHNHLPQNDETLSD
jgi:hypothetical protein